MDFLWPKAPSDWRLECWCHHCWPEGRPLDRMILCPECGNKRCPKASHHENKCTGSNESGQPGSVYK